ncbi:hypothetical protein F4009_08065 [Candidatus Poribacteria bacterium]|nr:hypothetical protein [Candidatus Poribacteria bacterium]MYH82712.1 hypothetical protein [Candidatus Poribacteria bacterium]MYK93938.1 hypothetical protein [Candidatus Poribacteria bacterium]
MNIQDMTDAEVYERGIEILLDKLGHAGTIRFIEQCEPPTGDYTAERHKWLDGLDMETIMQGIQELRQKKQEDPENEFPKDLSEMTDIEVYRFGLSVISGKLGPSGQMRFLRQCKSGTKDRALTHPKHLDKFASITKMQQERKMDPLRKKE